MSDQHRFHIGPPAPRERAASVSTSEATGRTMTGMVREVDGTRRMVEEISRSLR